MTAIHEAVRAGGEQRAQFEQVLAAEQALRDRQAQCTTLWDPETLAGWDPETLAGSPPAA